MINIIADSGCDISEALKGYASFSSIPLTLEINGASFVDDSTLNIDKFTELLKNHHRGRRTAAPSPLLYMQAIKKNVPNFIITLSSHLSGSYSSAVTAAKMFEEENGETDIFVVDSESASSGETQLAERLMEANRLNASFEWAKRDIIKHRDELSTYFILSHYESMVDNGRMNPYVAKLASMLNIVPICAGVDGNAVPISTTRGNKKLFAKLADLIKKSGKETEGKHLKITHVCANELAQRAKDELTKSLGFESCEIMKATGLCSVYADINGIILAF